MPDDHEARHKADFVGTEITANHDHFLFAIFTQAEFVCLDTEPQHCRKTRKSRKTRNHLMFSPASPA